MGVRGGRIQYQEYMTFNEVLNTIAHNIGRHTVLSCFIKELDSDLS